VTLARELRAETRVKHGGIPAFERVDTHPARLTLTQQKLGRIEPGEIVQHPSHERPFGIVTVTASQTACQSRDAQRVREPMPLSDLLADLFGKADEIGSRQPKSAARSACSRFR